MSNRILDFYQGSGTDHRGRTIVDVWSFNFQSLEAVHDYIQWLFPSWIRSRFSAEAPILDEHTQKEFSTNPELQIRLLESLDVMLDFYGLTRDDNAIRRAPHFDDRTSSWLTSGNHNHLRLTRILGTLWTLGCKAQAEQLYDCLEAIVLEYPDRITDKTRNYWAESVRREF